MNRFHWLTIEMYCQQWSYLMIIEEYHSRISFKILRSLSTVRIQLVNFSCHWRSFEDIIGERRCILMLRERFWTCSQREEHLMHVDTILSMSVSWNHWKNLTKVFTETEYHPFKWSEILMNILHYTIDYLKCISMLYQHLISKYQLNFI